MTKHVRGPLAGHKTIPDGMLAQELARQEALATIRRLRKEARDEIERLLAFLDASDIDPDLEPSLGFVEGHPSAYDTSDGYSLYGWPYSTNEGAQDRSQGGSDDRELDDDDREPSLCGVSVTSGGDGRDLEDDNEHEPNLGSLEHHPAPYLTQSEADGCLDQSRWGASETNDAEDEHDGREEGYDQEDDRADREPSLGWTERGVFGEVQDMELS